MQWHLCSVICRQFGADRQNAANEQDDPAGVQHQQWDGDEGHDPGQQQVVAARETWRDQTGTEPEESDTAGGAEATDRKHDTSHKISGPQLRELHSNLPADKQETRGHRRPGSRIDVTGTAPHRGMPRCGRETSSDIVRPTDVVVPEGLPDMVGSMRNVLRL